MEVFNTFGNPFLGSTFACVAAENHNNFVGGDIYYYLYPENPNPFTKAQIDAVQKYTLSNIICANSGLKETNKIWYVQ